MKEDGLLQYPDTSVVAQNNNIDVFQSATYSKTEEISIINSHSETPDPVLFSC
jgi:hypothetical protein